MSRGLWDRALKGNVHSNNAVHCCVSCSALCILQCELLEIEGFVESFHWN